MPADIEAMERKAKRLEALLSTTKMLNSTLETDFILKTLIEETLRLLDAGDAAILFLLNSTTNLLEVRSYTGFDREIENVRLRPGESMTGITFARKTPMLFQTAAEIQKAQSTLTRESQELSDRVLGRIPAKLKSSICCPLIYRDECIGVIVVDNFKKDYLFTGEDLELLQAISNQATIAIMNAINYEKDMKMMKKMEQYNRIIKEQHSRYRHSTIIHNRLTNMVLKGCTLQDIAGEISLLMGKSIIVYDAFLNIKAHSFSDDDHAGDYLINRDSFSDRIMDTAPWEYRDENTGLSMVMNPIVVSEDILGWIGVVGERLPYKEMDKITVERGRTILALEFLKQNEIQEIEQRLKGDFLDNLLADQDRDYVKRCAENYGYDFSKNYCIAVMELYERGSDIDRGEVLTRHNFVRRKNIFFIISRIVLKLFPGSITINKGGCMISILEMPEDGNNKSIKDAITHMVEAVVFEMSAYYSDFEIYTGVGRQFSDLFRLKSSYDDAMKALRILGKLQKKRPVLFFDELEIKKFLFSNNPAELKEFAYETLGRLINYENSSREEFLNTLKYYIRSNGNWSLTRDKLHIHGNTLNYRLNRIKEILGLDLDDYSDRLKIQIAFEILDLLDAI
ncbi:MAG: hypothetical protein HPY66_2218 [Firmicutes bacterium]|nr:hypothetical protein [Bacillota bacterium]